MWTGVWCKNVPYVRSVHATFLDCALLVLHIAFAPLHIHYSNLEAARAATGGGRALGLRGLMDDPSPFLLCHSVTTAEVLAMPVEEFCNCMGIVYRANRACWG